MAGLDSITNLLPSKSRVLSIGSTAFNITTIIIILIIFAVLAAIIVYLIFRFLKFNKTILIFEKVGNKWQQTGKDKAMEIKYGLAGDTVFYLSRRKKYLPRPELQMGKRAYWFGIREDGEWINIDIEDVDMAMKKAKAHFLHPEMRYARTSLLGNLKERYDKPKFMEKYGVMLINLGAIIVILVFMYLIVDKIIAMGGTANTMLTSSTDKTNAVLDRLDGLLAKMDNICAGSGIR